MSRRPPCISTLAVLAATVVLPHTGPGQDPTKTTGDEQATRPSIRWWAGWYGSEAREDVEELIVSGGARYIDERARLDVRCDRALLVFDRQAAANALRVQDSPTGLPRRTPRLPAARRLLGEDVLRGRMNSFLSALNRRKANTRRIDFDIELFRSVYLEGDVSVIQDGVEVLRADSVLYSTVDDRAVFRGVLMRLRDVDPSGAPVEVTLRTAKLTREGGRFIGHDVSITTCPAGEPQFEILSGEVEIIERASSFEIRARENALAFSRRSIVPLPDQTLFTDAQKPFPIKSASAGYSGREGMRTEVVFGGGFNEVGGSIHEWLTGGPSDEFRGDWTLGVGWNQSRGVPLDGSLDYRGGDRYEGETLGFFLDDGGEDLRDIRRNIDGSPFGVTQRTALWSENRVHLGEKSSLDLSVFNASDAGVWSEFYSDRYYNDERPETSLHGRHSVDNWIATLTGRWNINDFSYADGRQLDQRFVEEEPYFTFDLYSQPVAELPGETPLLLTTSTGIAQLRSDFDPRVTNPVDDETVRVDQSIELAAPFGLGWMRVRPFADARFTHFDNTVPGTGFDRWALSAGLEVGTRMDRTWEWTDNRGEAQALRHVVSPTIRFEDRYRVDGDPNELFQFDQVDTLRQGSNVRVGVLQRFQRRTSKGDGVSDIRESLWVDLAQNFEPDPALDGGDHVGLGEFELLVRPQPIADQVQLGIGTEGEIDWQQNELRTFNNYLQVQTARVTWIGQYRADRTDDGQIGYGVSIPTRERWIMSGFSLYDLATSQNISYDLRLVRADLNWLLTVGLTYDVVSDDTSLAIQFEPKLGGLFRPRPPRTLGNYDFMGGQPLAY